MGFPDINNSKLTQCSLPEQYSPEFLSEPYGQSMGVEPELLASFDLAAAGSCKADGSESGVDPAEVKHQQGQGGPMLGWVNSPLHSPDKAVEQGAAKVVAEGTKKLVTWAVGKVGPVAATLIAGAGAVVTGTAEVAGLAALGDGLIDAATGAGRFAGFLPPAREDEYTVYDWPAPPGQTPTESEERSKTYLERYVPLPPDLDLAETTNLKPDEELPDAARQYYWNQQHTPFYKTARELGDPNQELFAQPAPMLTKEQREALAMQPRAQGGNGEGAAVGGQALSGSNTSAVELFWDGVGEFDEHGFAPGPWIRPAQADLPNDFRQVYQRSPQIRDDANPRFPPATLAGDSLLNAIEQTATQSGRVIELRDVTMDTAFKFPGALVGYVGTPEDVMYEWGGKEYPVKSVEVKLFERRAPFNQSHDPAVAAAIEPAVSLVTGGVTRLTYDLVATARVIYVLPKGKAASQPTAADVVNSLVAQNPGSTLSGSYPLGPGRFSESNKIGDQQATSTATRFGAGIVTSGYRRITYFGEEGPFANQSGPVGKLLNQIGLNSVADWLSGKGFLPGTKPVAQPWLMSLTRPTEVLPNPRGKSDPPVSAVFETEVYSWRPGREPQLVSTFEMTGKNVEIKPGASPKPTVAPLRNVRMPTADVPGQGNGR